MNLICTGAGAIPIWLEMASGNHSDQAKFAEILGAFQDQWHFDGLCVAASALYSQANLQSMAGLNWLTRVPLTLKEAQQSIEPANDFQPSELKGYSIAQSCSDYGGVKQRWFIILSAKRRISDLEQKGPQGTERGFRFLKDPLFLASSVFLKTPKRIAALGMIMALCLLVYRNAIADIKRTTHLVNP